LKHGGPITSVALSEKFNFAVSGGLDGVIILWNAETGDIIKNIVGHKKSISSVALSLRYEK